MTADDHAALRAALPDIAQPAWVIDTARLIANLEKLAAVRKEAGCEILYAIKAGPYAPLLHVIARYLDGATASGLYEARLGEEGFGKGAPIHVYCPAYTADEIAALAALGGDLHIYVNSIPQLTQFAPGLRAKGVKIGLRVNPGLSVTKHAKYDPCRRGSHLGVPMAELEAVPWNLVDTLHVHALCENMAAESGRLIMHVAEHMAPFLAQVKAVNFGGGHAVTWDGYDSNLLGAALRDFRLRYPELKTSIEPGGAVWRNAGYLVGHVLDIRHNDGEDTAILDISANCHAPDVVKGAVRFEVLDAAEDKPHQYTLAARTCMACDIWGRYGFDKPLEPGDPVVFLDAAHYTFGEANWFNGHPRPDLGMLRRGGGYEVLRRYDYEDFRKNCG